MHRSIRTAAAVVTLVFALVACGSATPATSATGDLVGRTWRLSESTVPALTDGGIDPALYTIEFLADGNFAAQVDCNRVLGAYTATDGGGLSITPGPSTMVACPEGSLAPDYLAALQTTTSSSMADGRLVLTTAGGTLTFQ